MAMTAAERPATLIFLHIPKAAGSTLRDLLLRRFPARRTQHTACLKTRTGRTIASLSWLRSSGPGCAW